LGTVFEGESYTRDVEPLPGLTPARGKCLSAEDASDAYAIRNIRALATKRSKNFNQFFNDFERTLDEQKKYRGILCDYSRPGRSSFFKLSRFCRESTAFRLYCIYGDSLSNMSPEEVDQDVLATFIDDVKQLTVNDFLQKYRKALAPRQRPDRYFVYSLISDRIRRSHNGYGQAYGMVGLFTAIHKSGEAKVDRGRVYRIFPDQPLSRQTQLQGEWSGTGAITLFRTMIDFKVGVREPAGADLSQRYEGMLSLHRLDDEERPLFGPSRDRVPPITRASFLYKMQGYFYDYFRQANPSGRAYAEELQPEKFGKIAHWMENEDSRRKKDIDLYKAIIDRAERVQ
jgi:hypothetical protein